MSYECHNWSESPLHCIIILISFISSKQESPHISLINFNLVNTLLTEQLESWDNIMILNAYLKLEKLALSITLIFHHSQILQAFSLGSFFQIFTSLLSSLRCLLLLCILVLNCLVESMLLSQLNGALVWDIASRISLFNDSRNLGVNCL